MASRSGRLRNKLCRNFALGYCAQGSECKFLHVTTAPMSPPPSVSQFIYPSLNPSEPNPQRSLPGPMPPSPAQWMAMSPSNHSSETAPYTWANSSTPCDPALHVPRTAVQYRPLSWRTTLCRHFARNRGWCPLGDECNYIHDLTLADIALKDVRFPSGGSYSAGLAKGIGGRGRAGSKHSHCWAYVQGLCHVKDCPYLHPLAIHLFVQHTPCLAWPNCDKGVLCPYKHPEPIIRKVQEPPVPIESPTRVQPSSPNDASFQTAYQYKGTTYFPPPSQVPLSPPQLEAQPSWHHPYDPWHQCFVPVPPQTSYGYTSPEVQLWQPQPVYEAGAPPAFQLPAYALDAYGGPVQEVVEYAPNTQPAPYHQPASEPAVAPSAEANEFPYVPPKDQRSGHARRISVVIKSKEDSDALGLFDARAPGRESWKTHAHGSRMSHRSWAPSSSSMDVARPTPMIY